MTNCEVITKADIGSDHRLERMTLRINKRLARLKTIRKQNSFNNNTQKLRGLKEIFEINLKNRFEKLEEEVTARSFSEIMKEEANKLADRTKGEPPVLSREDQEIKQLEDRRKELRKKEDRSHIEKIEYTQLNKTVKKKHRQRSQKKRTDHVETILQSGRGPKHICKRGPKKKICKIKNEENKIQTDRNEILKICSRFYSELYSSTSQYQHPSPKITNTDSSEDPPIMTSEVKKTMKEMKNIKAPGIDNLTSDVVLGGEESVKQLTKNFNQISETKKIPAE